MKKRTILIVVLTLLSLGADQITKQWARQTLKGAPAITVIPSYLELSYHENPGSAFGLMRNLPGGRYILTLIGLIVLVVVWFMLRKVQERKLLADSAFALVAGGALGNIIDRIYIGRVVDFIVMHWQTRYYWPAYNIADAVLVVGVGLLVLVLGRKPPEQRAPARGKSKGKRNR